MKLTKRAVDAAQYAGGTDYRWDDSLSGFGLRVYPSGRKSFVVSYRTQGRKKIMVLGKYGILTVDQARKRARVELGSVAQGNDPSREKQARARKVATMAEFTDLYLERHARPKKKSWPEDERRIQQYIRPSLGTLPLEQVGRAEVNHLYHQIGVEKPYEANRVLALLSTMFNLAIAWDALPSGSANPAKMPKSQRFKEQERDRPVNSAELPRLFQALKAEADPHIRAVVHLYILTGLRKSELLHARWENVDFDRGTLRLPDTKAGKPRHVPLSRTALEILEGLPKEPDNPHIFPSPVNPGAPRYGLFKPWRRIREQAGCADLRIHDLRHSVATWLAEEGHAAQFIQQALGHQSLATTMKYVHASAAGPRQALEGLGSKLAGLEKSQAEANP